MGPIALFDKSFIQSLNIDESVWYDHFYINNICPIFYIETLADLSKEMKKGRKAEDVVGNIADKTPENGLPNVFHLDLCRASLYGGNVPMFGQILISYGEPVSNDGKNGIMVEDTPENLALARWQERNFEEVERITANHWRNKVSSTDLSDYKRYIDYLPSDYESLKNLKDISECVDNFLSSSKYVANQVMLVHLLQQISMVDMNNIMKRWYSCGNCPISEFAPYASFVLKVDLIFILAMNKGIVSDQRPSNNVDIDYLKYLPFCNVFVSQDRLHKMLFPYICRKDQQFLWGIELKSSLKAVNDYFMLFPDDIKKQGINCFATYPPTEFNNLITSSWESFMKKKLPIGEREFHFPKKNKELTDQMSSFKSTHVKNVNMANPDFIAIKKRIHKKKGSWQVIPDDIE